MKKFIVLMIRDESNSFDLFNQTEIIGIKSSIKEAKILDEEIEFSIEESNEGRKVTIYDGEEGIYYNLMIKEF